VSWPLATFTIVGAILTCGWLAYERRRPSARMAAVVATLAAMAALGRDAFVALPEVKPITAMTFVVGYALGPLPGFAVGALGMLASNMVLGQGPYTPWQMAAWGLVGLAGAALGALSRRRLGRLGLAFACALAALGAKEIMNVYQWTIGAIHTPAAFLATAATSLPFDVVDVVSSFLFALAFAPELARVLTRQRTRMDIRWEAVGAATLLLAVALVLALGAVPGIGSARATAMPTATSTARAITTDSRLTSAPMATAAGLSLNREVAYLASAQNADGGFGEARGQASTELYSAWVAIGLAAAGRNPLGFTYRGYTVVDAMQRQASTLEGPGDMERTILALHACGVPAGSLGARNLVSELVRFRERNGSFENLVNITTFAVFALRALGHSANDPSVRAAGTWLARQQNGDGGFGFSPRGGSSDVDDTAAALQGLIDAGQGSSPGVARAVVFLLAAQNPDGGYPQQRGGSSNAQSTAWAVQGLIAAGRNVSAVRRGRGGRSPLEYLQSLIAPNGSVYYSRTSAQAPVWVTAQALTALAGRPFPVGPVG
jgi:energy-coupling factor transport system substrate-specific component